MGLGSLILKTFYPTGQENSWLWYLSSEPVNNWLQKSKMDRRHYGTQSIVIYWWFPDDLFQCLEQKIELLRDSFWHLQETTNVINCRHVLRQWFQTGVPRHTRVPQRGVRGATKFWITAFLYLFCYIGCHKLSFFNHVRMPPNFFNTWTVPWTKQG